MPNQSQSAYPVNLIREYIVDGLVEIVFVKSEENDADIFAKNVGKETYERHSDKFLKDMETI